MRCILNISNIHIYFKYKLKKIVGNFVLHSVLGETRHGEAGWNCVNDLILIDRPML